MDSVDAAKFLSRLPRRRRFEMICPICQRTFKATAAGVYCSTLCRAKAQTQRKTAARRARWEQAAPAEPPAST